MLKPYSANPMDLPQAIGFNLEYQHFHNNIFLQKYLGRVAELVHIARLYYCDACHDIFTSRPRALRAAGWS